MKIVVGVLDIGQIADVINLRVSFDVQCVCVATKNNAFDLVVTDFDRFWHIQNHFVSFAHESGSWETITLFFHIAREEQTSNAVADKNDPADEKHIFSDNVEHFQVVNADCGST